MNDGSSREHRFSRHGSPIRGFGDFINNLSGGSLLFLLNIAGKQITRVANGNFFHEITDSRGFVRFLAMEKEAKPATEDPKIDLFEDDDEFEEFNINKGGLNEAEDNFNYMYKAIDFPRKDLPRTFPGQPALDDDGANALRRLLMACARYKFLCWVLQGHEFICCFVAKVDCYISQGTGVMVSPLAISGSFDLLFPKIASEY